MTSRSWAWIFNFRSTYQDPVVWPHPLDGDSVRWFVQNNLHSGWVVVGCYGDRNLPLIGFKA